MTSFALSVRGLAVRYGRRLVFDDVALADYLEWERQDYQEAVAAIRQGAAPGR